MRNNRISDVEAGKIVAALLWLAFVVGVNVAWIWVAIHFIRKFW